MTSSLARTVFGTTFQNPVLLAAGTCGFGREVQGVIDLERLGGIMTKAVSKEPRKGNKAPRVAEFPFGMLNSVGLANPGLASITSATSPATRSTSPAPTPTRAGWSSGPTRPRPPR